MPLYPKQQSRDLEMVAKMAQREPEAFTEFYDLYAPMVFALLCRLLGDRAEAEDALQEAFWQIWRQAAAYDPARGSPVAWLVQISRSRGLDRRRRVQTRARRDVGPVEEWQEHLPAQDDTEREVMAREARQTIRRALAELPPDQKEAIALAYFDGLTHPEIAERLRAPLGTIKTRIRLGVRKLQEAFQATRKNDQPGL